MNLYHVTKFSPYFSFNVYCFYTKISSFMPVLSKRIVLDCFYLLIFYFEKFSTDVCRLPCAVNVNLNLSIIKTIILSIMLSTESRFSFCKIESRLLKKCHLVFIFVRRININQQIVFVHVYLGCKLLK